MSRQGPEDHTVMFYSRHEELTGKVADYLLGAVKDGGAAVIVATPEHRREVEILLGRAGLDLSAARANGSYVALDAAETAAAFLINGCPDPAAFWRTVSPVIERAGRRRRQVKVFGEMVALLWEEGALDAAIEVEALWNELAKQQRFALLCAYRRTVGDSAAEDELALVLSSHSAQVNLSAASLSGTEDQAAGRDASARRDEHRPVAWHLIHRRAAELAHRFGDAVHSVQVALAQLAAVRIQRQPPA